MGKERYLYNTVKQRKLEYWGHIKQNETRHCKWGKYRYHKKKTSVLKGWNNWINENNKLNKYKISLIWGLNAMEEYTESKAWLEKLRFASHGTPQPKFNQMLPTIKNVSDFGYTFWPKKYEQHENLGKGHGIGKLIYVLVMITFKKFKHVCWLQILKEKIIQISEIHFLK